jgi:hypothetical protein
MRTESNCGKNMQNKIFRYLILTLLLAGGVYGLGRLYYRLTDDFRISNITYSIPYRAEWDTPSLSESQRNELSSILNQNFYYLGKGAQSYAFESADGKYVLKFVKFKHIRSSFIMSSLGSALPYFKHLLDQSAERKDKKLNMIYGGYLLAFRLHRKEAGLIYLHLNPTDTFKKDVIVYDKMGLKRHVDLDQAIFVIQEKGKTLRTVLSKQRIRQIFDLYLSEYQKGIYDRDHGVMHNTGFVKETPIHLDVGKLYEAEEMKKKEIYQKDLDKIFYKIRLWLNTRYPDDASEIVADMQDKYKELFGEKFEEKEFVSIRKRDGL